MLSLFPHRFFFQLIRYFLRFSGLVDLVLDDSSDALDELGF
jgi:hypothetical protein